MSKNTTWDPIDFFLLCVCAFSLLLTCLLLMIAVVKASGGINYEYSEGQRTGTIYKLSRKGVIWKTWEGEMSLGLVASNSNGQLINRIFHFSISDDALAEELLEIDSDQIVTLKYRQYLMRGYKYGSTQYDIVDYSIKDDEQ